MSDAICCDECFDCLAKIDVNIAKKWMSFCDLDWSRDVYTWNSEAEWIRPMEEMNLILTSECSLGMIKVNILGRCEEKGIKYFCGGKCGKEKKTN